MIGLCSGFLPLVVSLIGGGEVPSSILAVVEHGRWPGGVLIFSFSFVFCTRVVLH